ncbi:putative transcription factor gsfR1 [Penicillium rolfsii]|nr:putative transcription factor gsfR1 [Penicillium rolfsii]
MSATRDRHLHENDALSTANSKRRKIRKGTHSCWECRQRKMKCTFTLPTDETCIRCHRRGIKCVSQEYPEEITTTLDRTLQIGDRIARVETLVEQLLRKASYADNSDGLYLTSKDESNNKGPSNFSGLSSDQIETVNLPKPLESQNSGHNTIGTGTKCSKVNAEKTSFLNPIKHEKLSQTLHTLLPSQQDVATILESCGNTSSLFYQMQTVPYEHLDKAKSLETLFMRPRSNVHPVLIARHMLHLATALQHLHPSSFPEMNGLSEPPREMMRRLADIATSYVTTNDDLISCVEGLDCMMIETWYHANGGYPRKALITIRRAMTIAQLMGFHRHGNIQCSILEKETQIYPELIWFRIISLERYLCMMLGTPQASPDRNIASETLLGEDTAMGRLDRTHCVVMSRILERNHTAPSVNDVALTQEIDQVLQNASREFPSKWWLIPNLATVANQPEALFWDMRRLFHHLSHYNLLIQLHLPFMLRSATTGHKYDCSRITCIYASREILSRFIMFHSFNRIAFSCRTVDYFGLMAAMTLLIAHLDGHRHLPSSTSEQPPYNSVLGSNNVLIHQRPSDRALIEQVHETMEEVSRLDGDSMSLQASSLLQRLMAIEAEAASKATSESTMQAPLRMQTSQPSSADGVTRVSIPSFGAIEIDQEGIISNESGEFSVGQITVENRERSRASDNVNGSISTAGRVQVHDVSAQRPEHQGMNTDTSQPLPSTNEEKNEEPLQSIGEDWALQNIDTAFFDSLMRGVGDDDSIDWSTWLNDLQPLHYHSGI